MPETVPLVVTLQVQSESISGSAGDPRGDATSFDGWLGLISIVERIQADLGDRTSAADVAEAHDRLREDER